MLFITQFLHPGFHYLLSQPEFPSLQLMRSPTQDYKKPQNNTVPVFFFYFFYYALFPLATGVCEPADDSKKKKRNDYWKGFLASAAMCAALTNIFPLRWPRCQEPGATVQTVAAARLSARGLSQRSGATVDCRGRERDQTDVCALWLGNIGVF